MSWHEKDWVIQLAKAMGKGQTVFKHPERISYNITHTVRTDLYKPEWVVFQTENEHESANR